MALTKPNEAILNLTATNALITANTPTKGTDVAAATTMTLGAGDFFDITGTTAITAIATHSPKRVTLQFDAGVVLTHHATNLILPGAANITTAAGDVFEFFEYNTADWVCTGVNLKSGRALVAPTTLAAAGFTSAELTVTADTLITSAHSLGAVPRLVSVRLVCKTADVGYAVADEIEATSLSSPTADQGATVSSNATNVYIAQASVMVVVGKASFNDSGITVGSWRWVIRAWA